MSTLTAATSSISGALSLSQCYRSESARAIAALAYSALGPGGAPTIKNEKSLFEAATTLVTEASGDRGLYLVQQRVLKQQVPRWHRPAAQPGKDHDGSAGFVAFSGQPRHLSEFVRRWQPWCGTIDPVNEFSL